jgi:hypothetical protein
MKADIFPVTRRTGVVTQDTQNEILIYDLETNQAFCLNQTSALIYGMCDGTKSVAEIRRSLSSTLKSDVSEELVWLALDRLRKEKLIENSDEISNHLAGMSRRSMIKKIGLGSMVALPIVASIVAPAAANAQSPVSCTVPNDTFDTPQINCSPSDQTTACANAGPTRCCSTLPATVVAGTCGAGDITCRCVAAPA